MADPMKDAAAAAAAVSATSNNDDDDVEDLYADLDEQVTAALAAAGESGDSNARDSYPATDGEEEVPEVDANEAVDLGDGTAGYSSSDEESDDGLHIVLNEDAGAPLPPPPVGRGEECLAEEGEDSGCRVKGSSVNDGGWATVGGLQCKGLLEKTTLPIMAQVDQGRQHMFQRDSNLFLTRNSTIFDIDIEAFQHKPWRQQGVDLGDYFNFNLDEEGWIKYWCSMESYKLKSVKAMSKVENYSGSEGRNVLAKPKGRAIHVEGSAHERVPSADLWRPIQRDSDVVIQVNMTLSPSNQSTSDDSSKKNQKFVTTERMSIDHPGDRHLKRSSLVVDRVVDKEVHAGGSPECSGSKLDRRDSSCERGQSSSPDYSDTLSGESKGDFYFKRANRHSDSRVFFEGTKLQDEHVKSDFYRHSSKSDRENSDSRSHSYTPSPADDRNHKATKPFWRGEAPFAGWGKSSDSFVDCKSDHNLLKSGHKTRKELRRQSVDGGKYVILVEKEKSTDSYPSRYDKKYEKRESSSYSLRTNYRNAVHNQFYEKQGYSTLERVALKNDKHYFNNSSHNHRRSSSHEFSEGEDVEKCFSSAKEWQQHHDHVYHSMLNSDMSDADDEQMYRERHCQEKKRARHDRSVDEFPHYTDYGFCERQGPEVRGRYRDKGRFSESNDERCRHANHLELYPRLKNSERDLPATGFPFKSSRNRCIDNKRIRNAKMVQYHYDVYHQKNNGSIPQSALCSDTVAETGRFILPVKRKLHADLGSMNQKNLADLSLLKGRRLMHDQSMVSDRRIYALKLHKFTEEIDTKAICNFGDMRNSNTVSNICVGRRHELENADNFRLNDRKTKFERRGNELRRVIEDDQKGHLPVGKYLCSSKQKHVHQNARKQNMGYHHLGNQYSKKSAHQNRQNEEDGEIEEGELIEQDHHDIISKSKLKPREVLKSVIETSSAEQLQLNDATAKDAAHTNGATRECDKHILEVMEKMQKRRERFKEAIAPKKEDGDMKELSVVACNTDHIQNQRPARKRRWGGNS
ncbi:FIP1 [Panicum miliaceum]|uniref:FIP1 n=1 Tax=Panicum miliaceum TaxID=4540 RepID=A0A3L6TR86_PANMI|nr:FIP1 [Panicum miliaceum]